MKLEDLIKPVYRSAGTSERADAFALSYTGDKIPTDSTEEIIDISSHEQEIRHLLGLAVDESLEKMAFPDYLLNDPEVVGFPDLEMQENIYTYATENVLPLVLDPVNPIAIVDIGAGRGDLSAFLEEKYSGTSGFEYYGYELNSIHRTAAKKKYNIELKKEDFAIQDEMNFSGWGFCIGSLNDDYGLFNPSSPESKFEYFGKLIDTCLKKISNGVVFILLNETSPEQENLIPFPIPEVVEFIDTKYPDLAFSVDASRFQGIYKLTVYNHYLQS